MNPSQAYKDLVHRSREIAHLDSAMELGYWDQRTNIPARGHAHRVRHLAALVRMRHKRFTDRRVGELLSIVEESGLVSDPLSVAAVNVREWRRIYDRLTRIPEKLAVEIARTTAEGEAVWEKTRLKNDWQRFKPYLEHVVALKREEAEVLGYENEPYDTLLDEYEPGETAKGIEGILTELTYVIMTLCERIFRSPRRCSPSVRNLRFPISAQESFAKEVARQLGYNLEAGRVDVATHPFSTGIGPGDVRITARFNDSDFKEGFFSVIHEAGHAMYSQGLPLEHWGEPICHTASLGLDESQSLLWENLVARSRGFWTYFHTMARTVFPALEDISTEEFHFFVNEVEPGLIRLNADEVTYHLHILIRFELELALMRNELEVADLPGAWKEKNVQYLGLVPPDYCDGVMQDVHWACGLIGYFPTYTLGHIYAAQIFDQARHELDSLEEQFAAGHFGQFREWLARNVYHEGARYRPRQLLKNVTGEDLNPRCLIEHLENKYTRLYEI